MEKSYEELIEELSCLCGIVPDYWDIFGKKHVATMETKKAILKAMRLNVESVEELKREIGERKWRRWRSFIDPAFVVSVNDQPLTIPVFIPAAENQEREISLSWVIESEDRNLFPDEHTLSDNLKSSEEKEIEGVRYIRVDLHDGVRREIGYYAITVSCTHPAPVFGGKNTTEKRARLIICPETCHLSPELEQGRAWGLGLNLYALRSERNWGIGDLGDLGTMVKWAADLGADFIGINPLHAIPNTKPFGSSPYSPISRLYRNFIYLDMENVPDLEEATGEFRREAERLRESEFVDYEEVACVKGKALRSAFDFFYDRHYRRNTRRGREFRRYLSEEGEPLESFATYMALTSRCGGTDISGRDLPLSLNWQEWPEEYRDSAGKGAKKFKTALKREVLFHSYVQWLLDNQLREVAEEARNSGMALGLYYDLAIGSIGGGSDAWLYRDVIADGAALGAPPDDFNPKGQDWGFPPLIPERLKETGYELFIRTIRKNMKYGGALRIDHALGMFRLFWIPRGMEPEDGAYVRCPSEDLLRIIALESVRNGTVVIAEDLGTIGENVRETLHRFRMLSYRLFYFERNYPSPSFVPPERYPEMALCAVTTHDLPTLHGYWTGRDIEVKRELGIIGEEHLGRMMRERERDKGLLLSALTVRGLWNEEPEGRISDMSPELCRAVYAYLALTPCKLVLAGLDDVMGTLNQQNLPGTVHEHPNWIQKAPLTIEEILSDKRFADLSEVFRKKIPR